MQPHSGGDFGLVAKTLVCGPDGILAVASFEPAHDEVRPRYLLEVVNERVVHRGAAERADDRHGLRCELLRHNYAEAGCDLRNEPDQDRRAFREHVLLISFPDNIGGNERASSYYRPSKSADALGDGLRGWACRIRTNKSAREPPYWICVTISPE